eukprot:COSAG05_NODE_5342_length_1202_cov_5.725953_1_plen_100_part_00
MVSPPDNICSGEVHARMLIADTDDFCIEIRAQKKSTVAIVPTMSYVHHIFGTAPKSAAHAAPGTIALSVLATPARNAQVGIATGWQHASQRHLAVACTF